MSAAAGATLGAALVLTACAGNPGDRQSDAPAAPTTSTALTGRDAAQAARPASPPTTATAPTTAPTATPAPTGPPSPCAKNKTRQLVLVKVREQHVWMCARRAIVYSSAVTTGAVDVPYARTPTGTFTVQGKERNRVLTLLSGEQYSVHYWIPFDAPLFGFHDSAWQKMPYGSQKYRTKGSHGCIHMPLPAMKFLYRWADVGASVAVKP